MTNQRRTLHSALDMTPEKLAFIAGGTPPSASASPQERPASVDSASTPAPRQPRVRRRSSTTRPVRRSEEASAASSWAHLRMPVTTRLRPATLEVLRRTCLERRLRGQGPSTLQEILEEAVQAWLERHADGP